MDRSPCLDCDHKYKSKNTERCMNCRKRLQYIREIGGMTHSLPFSKTDLGKGGKVDNSANAKFDPKEAETGFKICSNKECDQPKKPADSDHFYKSKNYKDGFNSRCIECIKKKSKEYNRQKKDPEAKPVVYMAKDLDNTFRSLFYGDDIQNNMVIVIPYIRWVDKIRKVNQADCVNYYFKVGFSGMSQPANYQCDTRDRAVCVRNKLLIQIENYHSNEGEGRGK